MSYQHTLTANITITTENTKLKSLTAQFLFSQRELFEEFIRAVILYFYYMYLNNGQLTKILGVKHVTTKSTRNTTKFKTIFGDIHVPQIQVRVVYSDGTKRQMSITRILLGVQRKHQIPDFMKELMGWIGSVSTYRVGHNILRTLTHFNCSLMSVWQSVQWQANRLKLDLSSQGTNEFEADATGIPTKNSGKRGSELKKVFQRKKDGTLHLVGMTIGRYKDKNNWISAFSRLKSALTKYKNVILASDGDSTLINTAQSISPKIKIQKDKWHVFHQLKYHLWKDGATKDIKNTIIAHFFKLTMLTKCSIPKRDKKITRYISLLSHFGYPCAANFLGNMMNGFYTHEEEGNTNMYTTKTERSMRTTNQRINVGIWSDKGALNVSKIRDAYYYNGISPLNWKKTA